MAGSWLYWILYKNQSLPSAYVVLQLNRNYVTICGGIVEFMFQIQEILDGR